MPDKRDADQWDVEQRLKWAQFTGDPNPTPYTTFQVAAMHGHLKRTPVVDTIILAPQDGFGCPVTGGIKLRRKVA